MKKKAKTKKIGIVPLADRVLIRPSDEREGEKKLPSGIIIPETVAKEKTDRGVVIAVGEGRLDEKSGKRVPPAVKPGQTVLFQWGDKVEIEGAEYYLVAEGSILAVIK